MNDVINLSLWQLALAYVFVIILLVIVRWRGLKREKLILIASVRMTVQLMIMGYWLLYVFNNPSWWLSSIMIAIMLGFAIWNIYKRVPFELSIQMKGLIAVSVIGGSMLSALIFVILIVGVRPWYEPQYLIPISGMIVGNSMTGITLALNRLYSDMSDKRDMIENSLMLGATPREATRPMINQSFDTALLPTINTMLGMGIISLPGMMTGQILSGTLPTTAIRYQIGIMLAIMGSLALTIITFLVLGCRLFFSHDAQLAEIRKRPEKPNLLQRIFKKQ
jgi:putative ABC transport system permease protein